MNIGDLVRCWDQEGYNRIGILLMHDKVLKTVAVCFQDTGETRTLASRDIELYKRSPENIKKIKKTLDSDA